MSSAALPSKEDALEIIKNTETLLRNPKKSFIPAMDALFTPCKTEQLTPIEVGLDYLPKSQKQPHPHLTHKARNSLTRTSLAPPHPLPPPPLPLPLPLPYPA